MAKELSGATSSGAPPVIDVGFAAPVYGGDYANVTSIALAMTVTSGQPIFLFYSTINANNIPTGISDDFSTPYTWTNILEESVDASHVAVVYVGTGGSGTSGTITTTNVSGDYPCATAIACTGADKTTPHAFCAIAGLATSGGAAGPWLGDINGLAGYGCLVYTCSGAALSGPWAGGFANSYQAYSGSNYAALGYLGHVSGPLALPTGAGNGEIEALVLVQ